MIKLILTDLDETLLHSDKTISQYSANVLSKCQKKGILVGFCTSRGKKNIENYVNDINPDVVICNGGACVYYKNELLHSVTFSFEETKNMLQAAYKVCGDNCEITLDTLDSIYWNKKEDKSTQYSFDALYDDFKDFSKFTECAMKICVQTDNAKNAEQIAKSVEACDYLPFSDIPWYKFSPAIATKEHSIKILCEKLNISTEEIIAFGDDFNDIGMLKLCGIGVAMQNAIEPVKQIANYITTTNNKDGVAKYIVNNIIDLNYSSPMKTSKITTERLELKPIEKSHLNQLFQISSDKETTKYMLFAYTENLEECSTFVQECEQNWATWNKNHKTTNLGLNFAILLKNTNTLIGTIELFILGTPDSAELGWMLNKNFQNQGYASEAAFALLDFAKSLGIKTFTAHCDKRNTPSFKLMKKLGLKLISDDGDRTYPKTGEQSKEIFCMQKL